MNAEQIIRTYFSGEKSEAFLIVMAGMICLVAAVWLWFWIREPFVEPQVAVMIWRPTAPVLLSPVVLF